MPQVLNKQQLTIRHFGPVAYINLELKDILIFIGSQASGKSTISKAIFFFKSLRDDLIIYINQCYSHNQFEGNITNFAKRAKNKFLKIYGPVLQFPEMQLNYQYGNGMEITVRSSQNNRFTDIIFDDNFRDSFRALIKQAEKLHQELQDKSSGFSSFREISDIKAKETTLFKSIETQVSKLFNDERDILFLPAGRSLVTTLSQQGHSINMGNERLSNDPEIEPENLIKLDYLMQSFINRIDNVKRIFSQPLINLIQDKFSADDNPETKQKVELAQNLINSILKGSYRYQNGTEYIEFGDAQSTLINFASSGQQEVIWILLLILLLILNQRQVFLVIEEPEAHLFPVAQKEVIDLIALLTNQTDNQIILTTHSPYILSSFNNLLYAYNLSLEKKEAVAQLVEPNLWINPDRLDAYILEGGEARSIVDQEMQLIKSAEIDKASDIIVDTFNQLFELED